VALALPALVLPWSAARPARADIPGVVFNTGTGHYYKMVTVSPAVTWSTAKSGAEALGGYLATINSSAEQTWIVANMGTTGNTVWVGGTDNQTEGTWTWVSGEPWSYTYWNSGEPNNSGDEDYLMLNTNGTWNDVYASFTIAKYIVEWNVNPNIPPPPTAPANLTVTTSTAQGVPNALAWTDMSVNEDTFEIQRRAGAPLFSPLSAVSANVTTYDDNALSPETEYTYRVRAVNLGGASAWSNEVTVTTPAIPVPPLPPSELVVTAVTTESVEIGWTDNSTDEDGFQVSWRTPTGTFQFAANLAPDVRQFTRAGFAPDADIVFGVRAFNGVGLSSYGQVSALTAPTLGVTTVRADLKDVPKPSKDSISMWAVFDFLPASPDGEFDPVAEGITVRAGTDAAPVVMAFPPNLPGWKIGKGKATWKSPGGSQPRYKIQVDLENRLVKVSAAGLELATPPANPMRVSVAIGNDAGTVHEDWETTKAGIFRVR